MTCPSCGYFNDVSVTHPIKITDKNGFPVPPTRRYTCLRCGTRYDNKGKVER